MDFYTASLTIMGHRYGIKIPNASEQALHQLLVSLPSFFARSSALGYRTDAFETKDADAYLFISQENRIGSAPHPDTEVVIEPYGLYVNSFVYLDEIEDYISKQFGVLEYIL